MVKYIKNIGGFGEFMRCPICGARLIEKKICPYCKITDEDILSASNRKVKDYRHTFRSDEIHYTNIIPSDLSKLKIILYTIFLGLFGVNYFYVLRPFRGWYSVISTIGSITIFTIGVSLGISPTEDNPLFYILYYVFIAMMAFNVIFWLNDLIAICFKNFKVPVVLPNKKEKK